MLRYRKTLLATGLVVVATAVLILLLFSTTTKSPPAHHPTTSVTTTTTPRASLIINPLTQNHKTLRARTGSIVLLSPTEKYRVTSNLRYVAPTTIKINHAFGPALRLLNPSTSTVTITWPGHRVTFKVTIFTPPTPSSTTTTSTTTTTTTTTLPPSTISSLNPTNASGKTITVANGATIYFTPKRNYRVTTQKYKIVIYAPLKKGSSSVSALIALGPGTTKVTVSWTGHSSTFTLTVRPPIRAKS